MNPVTSAITEQDRAATRMPLIMSHKGDPPKDYIEISDSISIGIRLGIAHISKVIEILQARKDEIETLMIGRSVTLVNNFGGKGDISDAPLYNEHHYITYQLLKLRTNYPI